MNKRNLMLWLTGRDMLVPKPTPPVSGCLASNSFTVLERRWEMTLVKNSDLHFYVATGPNFIHRAMQKLVLGIHWRMMPTNET